MRKLSLAALAGALVTGALVFAQIPAADAATACTVDYTANQWSTGFTADVKLTNNGPAISAWTLTWSFTGDQRVFLGWGQVWRTMMRDDALRQLVMTDSHSPGTIRAFAPLRNVDAWYEAFGVKEGDKNYVKPEDRVRIW